MKQQEKDQTEFEALLNSPLPEPDEAAKEKARAFLGQVGEHLSEKRGAKEVLRAVIPLVAGGAVGAQLSKDVFKNHQLFDNQAVTLVAGMLAGATASKIANKKLSPAQWVGAIRTLGYSLMVANGLKKTNGHRNIPLAIAGTTYVAIALNLVLNAVNKEHKENAVEGAAPEEKKDIPEGGNLLNRIHGVLYKVRHFREYPLEFMLAGATFAASLLCGQSLMAIKNKGFSRDNASGLLLAPAVAAFAYTLLRTPKQQSADPELDAILRNANDPDPKITADFFDKMVNALNPMLQPLRHYKEANDKNPLQLSMDMANLLPLYLYTKEPPKHWASATVSLSANIWTRFLNPSDYGKSDGGVSR